MFFGRALGKRERCEKARKVRVSFSHQMRDQNITRAPATQAKYDYIKPKAFFLIFVNIGSNIFLKKIALLAFGWNFAFEI